MKRKKGTSVIVRNEEQFNVMKDHLGSKAVYISWVPQMSEHETSIVIDCNKNMDYSSGSIGLAESQRNSGLEVLEYEEYFK